MVRTLACHARGRRFEPVPGRQFFASVAQSVEQGTENPRVDGSIPSGGTKNADVAHLVERHLAKVEVAGSSPVIRSKSKVSVTQMLFYFLKNFLTNKGLFFNSPFDCCVVNYSVPNNDVPYQEAYP